MDSFVNTPASPLSDDEVSNDAVQLLVVATFNGLCRVLTALADNDLIVLDQLAGVHDAMTTPLDDPIWRDDGFIASTRNTLEDVLSNAVRVLNELEPHR